MQHILPGTAGQWLLVPSPMLAEAQSLRTRARWVPRLGTGRAVTAHAIHPNLENAESFIMSQPLK